MIGLDFLQKIGAILQKSLSSEETYSAVFDMLEGIIAYDAATLFVVNEDLGELEVAVSRGPRPVNLAADVAFSRGEGLSGWIASQREPVVLPTLGVDGDARGFRSFVSVPLWSGDKLEGVLNLGHGEAGFYKQESKPDLEQLGVQLSLIVEQLRLRTELHDKHELLETALEELRSTQDALVEKERLAATGELVVALNHEINNPLTAIVSYLDLLIGKCGPEMAEFSEMLVKAKEAALRISAVTKRLEELDSTEPEEYLEGVKMLKLS